MKKTANKAISLILGTMILIMPVSVLADESDYGATGALSKDSYTIEDMITYAMEDEYLARAEYLAIMEKYGQIKPFTNIAKSESTHVALLKPLFENYGIAVPEDEAVKKVTAPETLKDSYKAGVDAEMLNIEMYEKFLKEDIPADVKAVLEKLKNASLKHLNAFQTNYDRAEGNVGVTTNQNKGNQGRGLMRGRNRGSRTFNTSF
ncbi:MAG: DUF2202 domain-containing protein [Clostridiaceae bacterium]